MNDWYLDPPDDEPHIPDCPQCGEEIEVDFLTGNERCSIFECLACKHRWVERWSAPDYGPEDIPLDDDDLEAMTEAYANSRPALCPHGNAWGECNPCDVAADFAHDAAREQRYSR